MARTSTIQIRNVDLWLLQRQAARLAELQDHLKTGEPYATADEWPRALEGILNMIASADEVNP